MSSFSNLASRKSELGRFLASIDWSVVSQASNCEAKSVLFTDFIKIGLDHLMPVKHVRLHLNDPPWVTERFKNLIKLRQHASTMETWNNTGDIEMMSTARANHFAANTLQAK